jgi:hypothetical protein
VVQPRFSHPQRYIQRWNYFTIPHDKSKSNVQHSKMTNLISALVAKYILAVWMACNAANTTRSEGRVEDKLRAHLCWFDDETTSCTNMGVFHTQIPIETLGKCSRGQELPNQLLLGLQSLQRTKSFFGLAPRFNNNIRRSPIPKFTIQRVPLPP